MKLTKFTTPARISVFVIHAAIFFALTSLSVFAQTITARPVARLISEPTGHGSYARPRRVNPEPAETVSTRSSLDQANEVERRAFEQTNRARVENGLAPLAWDGELCRLARAHSERMAVQQFFAHETPEGLQLKDRARANQIRFRVIGENIAYNKGYDDPGGFAVERWMISSGHRANILYSGFRSFRDWQLCCGRWQHLSNPGFYHPLDRSRKVRTVAAGI